MKTLRSRIIPVLLLSDGGLYKTCKFKKPQYLGDPLNAVRIFNEKKVDELTILDISASRNKNNINYSLLSRMASETRMPLCYGGGVSTINDFTALIGLGIEKISLNTSLFTNPSLISEASSRHGRQSVVASIDVVEPTLLHPSYRVFNYIKRTSRPISLTDHLKDIVSLGVGEVLVQSVTRDGTQTGYDRKLITLLKKQLTIPFTIAGGASSFQEITQLSLEHCPIGLGAGSVFVFKGKYKAVLLQYPHTPLNR